MPPSRPLSLGLFIGIFVPDTLVSDASIGHILAMLLPSLNELGLLPKLYRTTKGRELANCLADADLMFVRGLIDEIEHKMIRTDSSDM
jgi:hypothetical protein